MFKKTLAIILCLALLMLPCLAGAYVPLAIDGSAANKNAENAALRVSWQDAEATVYLPVKRYQQISGGWSEAQTYYPAVIRITYQYWTEKSAATDDTWTGAAWLDNGYPAIRCCLPRQHSIWNRQFRTSRTRVIISMRRATAIPCRLPAEFSKLPTTAACTIGWMERSTIRSAPR